jgi:hypothetical protein
VAAAVAGAPEEYSAISAAAGNGGAGSAAASWSEPPRCVAQECLTRQRLEILIRRIRPLASSKHSLCQRVTFVSS